MNNMNMGMNNMNMNNMNMGMNSPMPTGGTMMGNNAFTIGGGPQQMPTQTPQMQTPQMNQIPSIPTPGSLNVNSAATQSVQGTANPSIGSTNTAKVTI